MLEREVALGDDQKIILYFEVPQKVREFMEDEGLHEQDFAKNEIWEVLPYRDMLRLKDKKEEKVRVVINGILKKEPLKEIKLEPDELGEDKPLHMAFADLMENYAFSFLIFEA